MIPARVSSPGRPLLPIAALAFSLLALAEARPRERETPPSASPVPSEVRAACIQCHVLPPPDSFPRKAWEPTIYMMKGFALQGVGAPLGGPPPIIDFDLKRVVGYYESLAPASLPSPEPWPALGGDPGRFARHTFRVGGEGPPLVANVAFLDLDGKGRPLVVGAEMADGLVLGAEPTRSDGRLDVLGRVPHPCHVEVADLDGDGHADLVVADLGVVAPGDDEKGSVVWLRRQPDGAFRTVTLAAGLPRVADVQAADFDQDGERRHARRLPGEAVPRHPLAGEPRQLPVGSARDRGSARRGTGTGGGPGRGRRPGRGGLLLRPVRGGERPGRAP